MPPRIIVSVTDGSIVITDNGPGISTKTIRALLDFRPVSSREAYVSPTRGAQGNALKTILAMPVALDGTVGRVEIAARGINHTIEFKVDSDPAGARDQPMPRSLFSKKRHPPHGTLAGFSMLNPGQGRGSIFTNRRRLCVANPTSTSPVNWNGKRGSTHRPRSRPGNGCRSSDLPALVRPAAD